MINSYSESLGTYGGGAGECVERCGGMDDAPTCPRGLVNHMEELCVSLMPPRSSMSLQDVFFMLHGGSESECLHKELDDDVLDEDGRVFLLVKKFLTPFMIFLLHTLKNKHTNDFSLVKTHTIKVQSVAKIIVIFSEFLELIFGLKFFEWMSKLLG